MSNWLETKLTGLDYNEKLGRVENNLLYLKELIERLSKLDLTTIKDFELQFKDLKIEFEKLVLNFDTFKADIETIIQKNKTDIQKEQKDFENKILSLIEKSAIPGEIRSFGEVNKDDLIKVGWKQLEIENGFTLLNSFDNSQKIGINTSGQIAKHKHNIQFSVNWSVNPTTPETIYSNNIDYLSFINNVNDSDVQNIGNIPFELLDGNFKDGNSYVIPTKQLHRPAIYDESKYDDNKPRFYVYLKKDVSEEGLNKNNYSAGLYVNYFIFDPKDIYDPKTGLLKK